MKRCFVGWSLIILAAFAVAPAHAASLAPDPPRGVWAAEQTNAQAIGAATVWAKKSGDRWTAGVGERRAPGVPNGDSVVFDFAPSGQLRIAARGRLESAQWIQPADGNGVPAYATPVALRAAGGGWTGTLHPWSSHEHFFLVFGAAADGTTSVFLRNPEHNLGAFLGTCRVIQSAGSLTFECAGKPAFFADYSSEAGSIRLRQGFFPRDIVFKKVPAADPVTYTYSRPRVTADGWHTATLSDSGIDAAQIKAFIDSVVLARDESLRTPQIHSLLIARHGKLVLDAYFHGYDEERLHDVRSAGKSVATLLVGRAIADTNAATPQTPISEIFASYAPFAGDSAAKQKITIENLMTMSAGYACDDNAEGSPGGEDNMQSQTAVPDWYKFTLDLPMAFDPGTSAAYCSAQINLLGGVVTHLTHRLLPEYFSERFARPMQFGPYAMWLTPPPLRTAYMAGGDYFRPRDFLKFGELFLEGGKWNGRTIIGSQWLEASAKPQPHSPSEGGYGYGWHLYDYAVGAKHYRAVAAGGNGGQLVVAIPDLDVVIGMTGGNYAQYPVWRRFFSEYVPQYIIAAMH
jgi:CubicO group peptidase (beta-lactamase class C family)